MDNRINEIRAQIRKLRTRMFEAEAIMRDQINNDQECSEIATEILKMRAAMSELARERTKLGDNEPILVKSLFIPRHPDEARSFPIPPKKRRLVPPGNSPPTL